MKFRFILLLTIILLILTGCGVIDMPEESDLPIITTTAITTEHSVAETVTTKETISTTITTAASTSAEQKQTSAITTEAKKIDKGTKTTVSSAAVTTAAESESKPTPVTSGDRVISDGTETEQDDFLTDPIPTGMSMPVEPQDAEINEEKKLTCTMSIDCLTILENIDSLDEDKVDILPNDGYILPPVEVEFSEGESVFDVLKRVCMERKIHMEFSWTPVYNSAYIEGIGNLYEFDCGSLSGWMYRVNGWYPNYGCSRYQLVDGEVVEWRYTCDLGNDVGGGYAVGGT